MRYGAVEYAVREAGYGGHGRAQFMGDVGHEFLTLVLTLLERVGHEVERLKKGAYLIVAVFLGVHANGKIAHGEFPRRQCQLIQGLGHFLGIYEAHEHSNEHHRDADREHNAHKGLPAAHDDDVV